MKRNKVKFTVRAIIGFLIYMLILPTLLFWAGGSINWTEAWLYSGFIFLSMVGSRLITFIKHPELLEERGKYTQRDDVPKWDRFLVSLVALYGPMIVLIVAGLDHRYEWSPGVPGAVQIAAGICIVLGFGIAVWAMLENQFFSSVVRIQQERGQFIVRTGPYRLVRHPAYAGSCIAAFALPFFLEAWWAIIPTIFIISATLARTQLEDMFLKNNLAGYDEYAKQAPYRILPGIW